MWLHEVPLETARLLRLAEVCGATSVYLFAIIGLGLCLGGAGASGLLLLRFLYRRRNKLASWCRRRRGVTTTIAVPTHETPVPRQTDAPFPALPRAKTLHFPTQLDLDYGRSACWSFSTPRHPPLALSPLPDTLDRPEDSSISWRTA